MADTYYPIINSATAYCNSSDGKVRCSVDLHTTGESVKIVANLRIVGSGIIDTVTKTYPMGSSYRTFSFSMNHSFDVVDDYIVTFTITETGWTSKTASAYVKNFDYIREIIVPKGLRSAVGENNCIAVFQNTNFSLKVDTIHVGRTDGFSVADEFTATPSSGITVTGSASPLTVKSTTYGHGTIKLAPKTYNPTEGSVKIAERTIDVQTVTNSMPSFSASYDALSVTLMNNIIKAIYVVSAKKGYFFKNMKNFFSSSSATTVTAGTFYNNYNTQIKDVRNALSLVNDSVRMMCEQAGISNTLPASVPYTNAGKQWQKMVNEWCSKLTYMYNH